MEPNKVVYINEEDEVEEQYDNADKKDTLEEEDRTINEKENIEQHEDYEDYVDDDEYLKVTDQVSEGGGDDHLSDNESVNTMDILNIDPLYLRLTKFLQSSEGESVADTLKKIHEQLVLLNTKLEK